MKILANDGFPQCGIEVLMEKKYDVVTTKVPQEQLANYINSEGVGVLLVRSATKVRKELIDACPHLKIIGRGGVGMDNIDVEYAREKGMHVINTPSASSQSVAELVFAHLFSGCRFLQESNRKMPEQGGTSFNSLKKSYEKGMELRGKTLGIVGFGRIGQEVARIALGLGIKVIACDTMVGKASVRVDFYNHQYINVEIETEPLDVLIQHADFISLHIPAQNGAIIGREEISKMKHGAALINCARGGVINEEALMEALDDGRLSFAGLDVFVNEPEPSELILNHPKISLTPHIGASTEEAQDRIALSIVEQIESILLTKDSE